MRVLTFLALLPLAALGTEVERGDTYLEVRSTLGEPRGQLQVGEWRKLIYDRGEVELESGVVTKVALRSPEAQAAHDARRAAEAEIQRAEWTARETRLAAEGAAVKARKLADQNFLSSPAAYQLAFWQDFARAYPGVPVTEEIAIARLRVAEHEETRRARQEESRRIAELELRVREAEERAERAEAAANRNSYNGYYSFPGYYRGRSHRPVSFLPEYHWNTNVQPPYSTPSGNPAGRMDGAPYTTPSGNPAGSLGGAPYVTPSSSPLLQSHQPNRPIEDDRRDSDRRRRRG